MGRGAYDTTGIPGKQAEEFETPYSICSVDTPSIEEDHPLFELRDTCLQVVMAEFMQTKGRKRDHSVSVEGVDNTQTSIGDPTGLPRKRGHPSDCTSAVTDERQSPRAVTKRRTQDRRLTLACPYAKKDPVRYRDCYYRYSLSRIRDVKQHLTRCHRQPIYCPICNSTFEDEDKKDAHIRSRTCSPVPTFVVEGMSEKQKRELSRRVSSKMPEEQQWFAVFDILFYPHPRPRTPYHDNDLHPELNNFQDFMTARGPTIIAEVIAAKEAAESDLPYEERDLTALEKGVLEEGLNRIIEQWKNEKATADGETNIPHSSPPSSTADSGIAMQTDRLQTREESRKADVRSRIYYINARMARERPRGAQHPSQTEAPELEADVLHTGGGPDFRFQPTMDNPATSLERIPMDPSHQSEVSEVPESPMIPQLPKPLDFSALFPAVDESFDFDFDMPGWPT
ncbi:hypothetical protein GGR53DRAFT_524102 [Hypoxylon sp. FL1150]|nr:hypothetical protein GGR53DRAFT_524102 [Hypoxylon sp. FL1150]